MTSQELNDLAADAGVKWFDHQLEAFEGMAAQGDPLRSCLYYKTGAGKTLTSLVAVRQQRHSHALVVAPPSTHAAWHHWAGRVGMTVDAVSHAKFRMKDFRVARDTAVIADEFHMFGGHGGKGWTKIDRMARSLEAPLLALSATPSYNDAERVYCVQHVLDPFSIKGGYLEFLYRECETEQDPFSMTPKVTGFRNYGSAEEYLAALPYVYYLPDTVQYQIVDIELDIPLSPEFDTYNYDGRSHRIMSSQIEKKHRRIFNSLVEEKDRMINELVWDTLAQLCGESATPTLIFTNHSTVADAVGRTLCEQKVKHAVVTGSTSPKKKESYLSAFRDGVLDVLVGTASLATGTDGLDKVCDSLIILDDTEDDSLRRQLIGRIMPRGEDTDASKKQVHRILLS